MSVYDVNGDALTSAYSMNGNSLNYAYDVSGDVVFTKSGVDYSNYSFVQKWASKGIANTQGFDIYDGKVFWVSKSGNSTRDANCYVWNLSDGSQALDNQYITIYSGHGNNLSFDFPTLYATSGYTPHAYVNTLTNDFVATLSRILYLNDGSKDCDACIDDKNKSMLWSLGHNSSDTTSNPVDYNISKWNLTSLTENSDETYTPEKIKTITTPRPTCYYFQGCKVHDGILWYASGYASTAAYVYGVSTRTGEVLYTIDCNTTTEIEGISWVADADAVGGYALYVGFQGMMLRKYTFAELT